MYLTAPGAFTAITAHKKYDDDRDFDPSLWLSKPEIGSVLVFPGSNVHGVLPILRDRFHNTERVRLTLNFAFWVDRPCVFGNIVTQDDTYVEQPLTQSLERKPQPNTNRYGWGKNGIGKKSLPHHILQRFLNFKLLLAIHKASQYIK